MAFLPSQIGYGLSGGKPDYCGPKTIKGIVDGIKLFLAEQFVDEKKIGIWGVSRGATDATLVATMEPYIFNAAVLQSGAYEMNYHGLTPMVSYRASFACPASSADCLSRYLLTISSLMPVVDTK